jgi:hypothetical protein
VRTNLSSVPRPRLESLTGRFEHPEPNPGFSYICGEFTGIPGTRGRFSIVGLLSDYMVEADFEIGLNGVVTYVATITQPGSYLVRVEAENGEILSTTIDVPPPPADGGAPCPRPG